jgi:hypothetical protein
VMSEALEAVCKREQPLFKSRRRLRELHVTRSGCGRRGGKKHSFVERTNSSGACE